MQPLRGRNVTIPGIVSHQCWPLLGSPSLCWGPAHESPTGHIFPRDRTYLVDRRMYNPINIHNLLENRRHLKYVDVASSVATTSRLSIAQPGARTINFERWQMIWCDAKSL